MKFIKNNYFIIILIIIYFVSDIILTDLNPIGKSGYFDKNDIEKTQLLHPENEWERVFFGSSVIAASYIEQDGSYINLGIDYGTIKDIYRLLKQGRITITNELVIGLNDISFYDNLVTNPTYLNHKKWYGHYIYFNRDRLNPFLTDTFRRFINKEKVFDAGYTEQKKELYFGIISDEELEASNQRMLERFSYHIDECRENIDSLYALIDICAKNNIRLRAVWMPLNPKIPPTPTTLEVMEAANKVFSEKNIEVLDWCNEFEAEYFHDIGHLNYETGAPYFTSKINKWLNQ